MVLIDQLCDLVKWEQCFEIYIQGVDVLFFGLVLCGYVGYFDVMESVLVDGLWFVGDIFSQVDCGVFFYVICFDYICFEEFWLLGQWEWVGDWYCRMQEWLSWKVVVELYLDECVVGVFCVVGEVVFELMCELLDVG